MSDRPNSKFLNVSFSKPLPGYMTNYQQCRKLGSFVDVILHCHHPDSTDVTIYSAHSLLLSSASPYFKLLLESTFCEKFSPLNSSPKCDIRIIQQNCILPLNTYITYNKVDNSLFFCAKGVCSCNQVDNSKENEKMLLSVGVEHKPVTLKSYLSDKREAFLLITGIDPTLIKLILCFIYNEDFYIEEKDIPTFLDINKKLELTNYEALKGRLTTDSPNQCSNEEMASVSSFNEKHVLYTKFVSSVTSSESSVEKASPSDLITPTLSANGTNFSLLSVVTASGQVYPSITVTTMQTKFNFSYEVYSSILPAHTYVPSPLQMCGSSQFETKMISTENSEASTLHSRPTNIFDTNSEGNIAKPPENWKRTAPNIIASGDEGTKDDSLTVIAPSCTSESSSGSVNSLNFVKAVTSLKVKNGSFAFKNNSKKRRVRSLTRNFIKGLKLALKSKSGVNNLMRCLLTSSVLQLGEKYSNKNSSLALPEEKPINKNHSPTQAPQVDNGENATSSKVGIAMLETEANSNVAMNDSVELTLQVQASDFKLGEVISEPLKMDVDDFGSFSDSVSFKNCDMKDHFDYPQDYEVTAFNYGKVDKSSGLVSCIVCEVKLPSMQEMLDHVELCHYKGIISKSPHLCLDAKCPIAPIKRDLRRHVEHHLVSSPYRCQFCSFSSRYQRGVNVHMLYHKRSGIKIESSPNHEDKHSHDGKDIQPSNAVRKKVVLQNVLSSSLFGKLWAGVASKFKKNTKYYKVAAFAILRHGYSIPKRLESNVEVPPAKGDVNMLCSFCRMWLTSGDMIQAHYIRSHSLDLPFPCPFRKCHIYLRSSSHLYAHISSHIVSSKYSCKWCSYSASSKCGIALHAKSHKMRVAKTQL